MEHGSLQFFFSLYQFPVGRRLFALRQVARLSAQRGLAELQALAIEAIEQCQADVDKEAAWRRSRSTHEGKRVQAVVLDGQVDRTLTALASMLSNHVHAFGDEGLGVDAAAVLEHLFPEGSGAITSLPYESELAAAEGILRALRGRYAAQLEPLGLTRLVHLLEARLPAYAEALEQETTRELSYEEIRESRRSGQELLLRVVAKILADHGGPSEEDIELRTELLRPVVSQNRRLKESFAKRSVAQDVDPETGEEDEDGEVDDPGPVDGADIEPEEMDPVSVPPPAEDPVGVATEAR